MEQLTFDQYAAGILCACGCGEPTPMARFTNRAAGLIVGQPTRYINGHACRMRIDEHGRECGKCREYKPWDDFHVSRTTRYGHDTTCKPCIKQKRKASRAEQAKQPRQRGDKLCACGCGEFTYLADKTDHGSGRVKGQPAMYLKGHFRRGKDPGRVSAPKPGKRRAKAPGPYQRPSGANLKANYGITYAQYLAMVVNQCGACAICGDVPSEDPDRHIKVNKLFIDHDHTTGRIRELLCQACNLMLGKAADDPARLIAGAKYLAEWAS